MWRNARLIDRQLFAWAFGGGSAAAVVAALGAYQNQDGGFGNALEPDIRCPESQPRTTVVALQILAAVSGDSAMALRACDWLATVSTPEGGVPKLLPSAARYPLAPWWQPSGTAEINPTAGIVAALLEMGLSHPWLDRAMDFCWQFIETAQTDKPHDFLCIVKFLEHAPDRERALRAFTRITAQMRAAGVIALEPGASGYVKTPLDWAPRPSSLCRGLFPDALMTAHVDALAAKQCEDGGWAIPWPAIAPACEAEWRGHVTVESLLRLHAYGRLWNITIRPLTPADFAKAAEIDMRETDDHIYRQTGTEIAVEAKNWARPAWSPERYQALAETWSQALATGGAVLGAFAGDLLVGEVVWLPRIAEGMSQLESLHVSRACRRMGVARKLTDEVVRLARASGATKLYVSAAPTPSAVGFYRSVGFVPTETPNPELFALEPEDVHMIMQL